MILLLWIPYIYRILFAIFPCCPNSEIVLFKYLCRSCNGSWIIASMMNWVFHFYEWKMVDDSDFHQNELCSILNRTVNFSIRNALDNSWLSIYWPLRSLGLPFLWNHSGKYIINLFVNPVRFMDEGWILHLLMGYSEPFLSYHQRIQFVN